MTLELTALAEPRGWRLRMATWLIRVAARVIGVPLVIRVEPEPSPKPVPRKMAEYLQLTGEFEDAPRKWRRWYQRYRVESRKR